MALVRYNPLTDFVPSTFGDFVENFLNDKPGSVSAFNPAVDIIKNEKSFELHLVAPGMKRDEFSIDLDNNQLTISGERKKDEATQDKYTQTESRFGTFRRSFKLNDNIKQDGIKAKYEDGVLKIELPVLEKVDTRKVIAVK